MTDLGTDPLPIDVFPDPDRLPFEVLENVVNALASPPNLNSFVPTEEESRRIRALIACARVCRAWFPRAKAHLYATVWVRSKDELFRLCDALKSYPTLIPLIRRLVASPELRNSLNQPLLERIPLHRVLNTGCPFDQILISGLRLDSSPHIYTHLGALSRSVVYLGLKSVVFHSVRQVALIVGSFPCLARLSLVGNVFAHPTTDTEVAAFVTQMVKFDQHPKSLRVVESAGLNGYPALQLLGNGIEELSIGVSVDEPPSPILRHYRDHLPEYEGLTTLRVVLEPWMSFRLVSTEDQNEGTQVWVPIHGFILSILEAVRSSNLRTLEIALLPQEQDPDSTSPFPATKGLTSELLPETWKFRPRYRHTRQGVLDILFAEDIRSILGTPRFKNLAHVHFVVSENSLEHNRSWWIREVSKRLPHSRPSTVTTDVRYFLDETYHALWE